MQLNVSNIQHFSTGDGPGIRTTVFLKGCHLRCPWCHNPETLLAAPQTLTYPSRTVHYGQMLSVDEITAEIMEDFDFYGDNGGATVSGGEPMLQSEGLLPLCKMLKENGVSVIVDTAGDVAWEKFLSLLPYVDCWYFDCKTADIDAYGKVIRADGSRIFDNLSRLQQSGAKVQIRIPLIPGFNTDAASIDAIIGRLKEIGITQVDLLPFHRMADGKYKALGLAYPYAEVKPLEADELKIIEQHYRAAFAVTVEK